MGLSRVVLHRIHLVCWSLASSVRSHLRFKSAKIEVCCSNFLEKNFGEDFSEQRLPVRFEHRFVWNKKQIYTVFCSTNVLSSKTNPTSFLSALVVSSIILDDIIAAVS